MRRGYFIGTVEVIAGIYGVVTSVELMHTLQFLDSPQLYQLDNAGYIGVISFISSLGLCILGALLFFRGNYIRKLHLYFSPLIAIILVNNSGNLIELIYRYNFPLLSGINELVLVVCLVLLISLLYILFFINLIRSESE